MDYQRDSLSSCGVEASGWDAAENFFVERTALEWEGDDNEEVELHSPLQPGSVIFLRLLHSGSESFPIAYRATQIEQGNSEGKSRVRLSPLRRLETHKEGFARWQNSTRVA